MSNKRKDRLGMLDGLTGSQAPSPAPAAGTANRALRSARGAVDETKVWNIDPDHVVDDRPEDRMRSDPDPDLVESIRETGQTVPILVRRDPRHEDRYRLIYGRRRLDAVMAINAERDEGSKLFLRALIRDLDDRAAVTAQASENAARRDLSYAEKALFAHRLVEEGFGTQDQVAAVLSSSKSAISMAVKLVRELTPELIRAIGPAHGVGRPRWEELRKAVADSDLSPEELIKTAKAARRAEGEEGDLQAFEKALRAAKASSVSDDSTPKPETARPAPVTINGARAGTVKRTKTGVRLDLTAKEDAFAAWLEKQGPEVIKELHARYKGAGDNEDEQQKGGTDTGKT